MTKKADVLLRLTEPMLGPIPKNEEIFAKYVESKRVTGGSDEVDIETIEENGWTGFHNDEKGIFIFDYVIRGFLKYWGNLKKEEFGVKALRAKITDSVYVFPRRIYLEDEKGEIIKEPAGVVERSLRIMTPQGPRTTIKRSDYVSIGTIVRFNIDLIDVGKNEVTMEMLRSLLENGKYAGLGEFRNGSYGRFEIVEFNEVEVM